MQFLSQLHLTFLPEINKLMLKLMWKCKAPRIATKSWGREEQSWGTHISISKLITQWCCVTWLLLQSRQCANGIRRNWQIIRKLWNKPPYSCQLIFNMITNTIQRRKPTFLTNGARPSGQKSEVGTLQITHKPPNGP